MAWLAVVLATVTLASCKEHEETTASVNGCAVRLNRSYDPKVLEQCVAACIACDRGVPTTCSTSCTLKGAR